MSVGNKDESPSPELSMFLPICFQRSAYREITAESLRECSSQGENRRIFASIALTITKELSRSSIDLTKHIGMDYRCPNCGYSFLPIKGWTECPNCTENSEMCFSLAEAVYDAGVYHRRTHYGGGSHMPSVWGVFSYGDHLAQWGFRLFDWLMNQLQSKQPPNLDEYLECLSLPNDRKGDYFRFVLQSFYDVFITNELGLK